MRIYKNVDVDKEYFISKLHQILYECSENTRNFDIEHTFISYKDSFSCSRQLDELTDEFQQYCEELNYNEECKELYVYFLKVYQGIETDDDYFPVPEIHHLKKVFQDKERQ